MNEMSDIENTIERVRVFTLAAVKKSRYEHSMRVAEEAYNLSSKYALPNPRLAYLAGVGHDMCKDMDREVLLSLAAHDGEEIGEIEMERPSLLHGRAAAVKMRRDFNVDDESVIEAVAVHTFGKAGMSDIAKVLYIADKIEPGRSFVDKKYIASIAPLSMDELLIKVVSDGIKYLNKKGCTVSPKTLLLLKSLRGNQCA